MSNEFLDYVEDIVDAMEFESTLGAIPIGSNEKDWGDLSTNR